MAEAARPLYVVFPGGGPLGPCEGCGEDPGWLPVGGEDSVLLLRLCRCQAVLYWDEQHGACPACETAARPLPLRHVHSRPARVWP